MKPLNVLENCETPVKFRIEVALIKSGRKSERNGLQIVMFHQLDRLTRASFLQERAVGVNGIETEICRHLATLRKRQNVADRSAVRIVRVGGRICDVQSSKPIVLARRC
jgi:hypothetical protein